MGHFGCRDVVGHADAHRGGAGGLRDQRQRLVLQRQDPPGVAEQALARHRQAHGPRGTVDQFPADRLLEAGDLLAHRRLGHVQPVGRGGEAAGIGDRHEGPEQARIEHGASIENRNDSYLNI